jgi:hypothetical protein
MSENNSTPDQTNPTAPTQAYAPVADPVAEKPAKRRGRTALIAGGAALGAILLIGGGVAIGSALDGEDDDDTLGGVVTGQQSSNDGAQGTTDGTQGTTDGAQVDDDGSDDVDGDDGAATTTGEFGAASADELDGIAQAAQGVAEGEPTAIDANRDGSWDVTLRGADGAEAEVLVGADGQAVVRETEAAESDDRAPQNVLDSQTLATMVDAALAEQPGRVIDIDADDDNRSPFDVSILTGDRQIVEVTLDASGAVMKTELDD